LKLLIYFTLAATILFSPLYALAHESGTDENVTAVLHIDPNDAPYVGHEAKFYLAFNGADFTVEQCNCTAKVMMGDKEIASQDFSGSGSLASRTSQPILTTTFSQAGDYTLNFFGHPAKRCRLPWL
jgi:hypothetical protein